MQRHLVRLTAVNWQLYYVVLAFCGDLDRSARMRDSVIIPLFNMLSVSHVIRNYHFCSIRDRISIDLSRPCFQVLSNCPIFVPWPCRPRTDDSRFIFGSLSLYTFYAQRGICIANNTSCQHASSHSVLLKHLFETNKGFRKTVRILLATLFHLPSLILHDNFQEAGSQTQI